MFNCSGHAKQPKQSNLMASHRLTQAAVSCLFCFITCTLNIDSSIAWAYLHITPTGAFTTSHSNWALCSYNSFHSPGKAFYKILKCLWKCLPVHPEEHFWGQTPTWDTHNLCSRSSQRCLMGLRSELYVGQSSSSTPNSSNISFLDLVWKLQKFMVNWSINIFLHWN